MSAWGNAPGTQCDMQTLSAESAIHRGDLSRAFSAFKEFGSKILGAMPQAFNEDAPLALDTYVASARCMALRLGLIKRPRNRSAESG